MQCDISISWIKQHRRSQELASALHFTPFFIAADSGFLPFRYLKQWKLTRKILKEAGPLRSVMVMQPPPIALFCVAFHTHKAHTKIVGDLHTGAFDDPKWRWSRKIVLRILKRRGMAVVPNEELAERCRASGVQTVVSHGYLDRFESNPHERDSQHGSVEAGVILAPLSYSRDEPINEILQAASENTDLEWHLTGKAPQAWRDIAPKNVIFTGFVSREDYNELRRRAQVVLALTTQESTMQSAGYEALSAATPLITSPTRVLVDYFGEGAIYAAPTAQAISRAIREAVQSSVVWRAKMHEVREAKIASQDSAIREIKESLGTLNLSG
jgi:glycosyltransferase involved in cell wall biosynthesis